VRSKDWRNYWRQKKGYQYRSKKNNEKERSRIRRLFIASMNVRASELVKK